MLEFSGVMIKEVDDGTEMDFTGTESGKNKRS
jgi:hypothetical protein